MNPESRAIQDAVRRLAGTNLYKGSIVGEVTAVDEDNRTISIDSSIDGASLSYDNVNLSAERNDGFIQIPAIGSTVICNKLPDGNLYVWLYSDIDKIICYIDSGNKFEFSSAGFVFNGGALGGLVKLAAAVSKYNALENKVNAILAAITTTWIPVANDGGAALKALFGSLAATTLAPVAITVNSDIENPDIKQ